MDTDTTQLDTDQVEATKAIERELVDIKDTAALTMLQAIGTNTKYLKRFAKHLNVQIDDSTEDSPISTNTSVIPANIRKLAESFIKTD